MITLNLQQSFGQLCSPFVQDEKLVAELWAEIVIQYSAKSRHYHSLAHVENLLKQANAHQAAIEDFEVLQFSIWYHDIIYKATRKDNEWQSAEKAKIRLAQLNLNSKRIERCAAQILLTQNHQVEHAPLDDQYLIDFDLSILGSDWDTYEEYAKQVRKEFKIYPKFLYRKGRKKALKAFLARPRIYSTPVYYEKFEANARANLQMEMDKL